MLQGCHSPLTSLEVVRRLESIVHLSTLCYTKGLLRNKESFCWLWSLIIFLIQRSLLSAVFIPHEVFTPQKYVHSSTRGSAEGGYPLCGVRGGYPPGWGVWGQSGPPVGVRGRSPRSKNCLVKVYCNFIVNLDRSL
jgi:hypothetical protein